MDYSILQQCMHCGMCLPTCPTYVSTRMERNSPRGRIAWMRAIADGDMPLGRAFADEMYYCLGCLACTTACPAGVNYPDLFEAARADVEEHKAAGRGQRDFWRWLAVKTVFMHPRLLRFVGRGIWFYQASGLQGLLRMSGLLWPEAGQRIANSAYLTRESRGHGQIILFAGQPVYRGATLGTNRLLLNALVYGPGMGAQTVVTP